MNFFKTYFSGYKKSGGIKELMVLALPMIISTACDGAMTFTDRLFLARVGSEQMNASMGGYIALQTIMFFFVGLIGYSTALVAQYFGANEKQNSSKAAFQAIILALIAWPVILLIKPLAIKFFYFVNLPPAQIEYQVQYLNILTWGVGFGMLRYTLGCYFTGIGKTKIVMTATITAMLVNIVFDYILVFGKLGFPAMGVRGAAIATVFGWFCAVLVLIAAYFKRDNYHEFSIGKSFKFDFVIFKKLLYYGYPAGLEMFLNFLAFSTMIAILHSQGSVVATATTIMFNWDMVSFIPLLGIEIAVTSLVGRYMGAGKPHYAQRSAISGIKIGLFYSIAILVLFVFIPETLVRVFRPELSDAIFEGAVPIAVTMIRIATLYVLSEAVLVALIGALRGAGDTHFTMIASVTAHWFFVPIVFVSLNILHLSVIISWLLTVTFFLVFCGVIYLRFKSGKWKNIKVIQAEN